MLALVLPICAKSKPAVRPQTYYCIVTVVLIALPNHEMATGGTVAEVVLLCLAVREIV